MMGTMIENRGRYIGHTSGFFSWTSDWKFARLINEHNALTLLQKEQKNENSHITTIITKISKSRRH